MMLSYENVFEIGEKGTRLGLWSLAFPSVPSGRLGLRVLRSQWEFVPVDSLEHMTELAPILEEIRKREIKNAREKENH